MIVDLQKYLIYGSKEEVDRFFSLSQRAGFIEFIGIWQKKSLELPAHLKGLLQSIKILRHWESSEAGLKISIPDEPSQLAEKVVETNRYLESLLEEKRILQAEIARIAPFGHFSREDLDFIESQGKRTVQFFCMKSSQDSQSDIPSDLIYLGTEYDLSYYVGIHKERIQIPKMIEIFIEKPVGYLKERLVDVRAKISTSEAFLKSASKHLSFLQEGLTQGLNEYDLHSVKHDASYPMSESLFAIEAWVPKTRIKSLQALVSTLSVVCEPIAIEAHDRVPTCMENKSPSKVGQDLVEVYDIPDPTDKDPSPWVLGFFSLFFAMIIADAGYGLLFLLLGLFVKWKFPNLHGGGRRFLRLIFILGASTVLWGTLTASFFGLEIGADSSFRKMSLLHYLAKRKAEYVMHTKNDVYQEYVQNYPSVAEAKDGHEFLLLATTERDGQTHYVALTNFYDNMLMEFALMIGIFHLSIAFLRYLRRNWSGLGWIFFMVGGYLYFPVASLDAISIVHFMGWISMPVAYIAGAQLMYGGIGLAVMAALIRKGVLAGIMELLNVIQVFSDVLSYLRLYALGLAGMIVAQTFNGLGGQFSVVLGTFIVLIGHAVNINLSVMSGVIHGLRLNFLEWYHYCFEGGGRLFKPLRLRKSKH